MEYSHHSLILLTGFAVAGLTLFGAIAVGPYGRRGVRLMLALMSFAALLGSAFYLMTYLGFIEQRRAIETRLAELRAQALGAGSALACLERSGEMMEAACAQALFAAPETLAAANFYTAARLDLLMAAARYSGPRTPQFDGAVAALQRSLQQDPFGLTANILVLNQGCTATRCEAIAAFNDPTRLWENIRRKAFDANVAHHAANWKAPAAAAPAAAAASSPAGTIIAPTGGETRAPIPDRYSLPSSSSIPPVSIMSEEPPRAAPAPPQTKDRPASATPASTAAPAEEPQQQTTAPAAQKQPPARRETRRPGAPMSIAPSQ